MLAVIFVMKSSDIRQHINQLQLYVMTKAEEDLQLRPRERCDVDESVIMMYEVMKRCLAETPDAIMFKHIPGFHVP